MIPPFHKKIGLIGGGQLGKMLIESTQSWNVQWNVLDPDPNAPAKKHATTFIQGSLHDAEKIQQLANISDILTYEIENINVEYLQKLESQGYTIIPQPSVLQTIKDKGKQKEFYRTHNIPTASFVIIENSSQYESAKNKIQGEQVVIKSCTGGYDGKGVTIANKKDITVENFPYTGSCVIEEMIEDAEEYSVIIARDRDGNTKIFPLVAMHMDPEAHLVDYLYSPARIPEYIEQELQNAALQAIHGLNGIGVFAVECFVDKNESVYINEIAPRPHNSGHHTIEACSSSQYEMLSRILLDLPLGETHQNTYALMINIVGPENVTGPYQCHNIDTILTIPDVFIHLYNKSETRPYRKIGHITCLGESLEQCQQKAHTIRTLFSIHPLTSSL